MVVKLELSDDEIEQIKQGQIVSCKDENPELYAEVIYMIMKKDTCTSDKINENLTEEEE